VLLSNALELALPHAFVSSVDLARHVLVDGLVEAGGGSVLEGAELLVMAGNVLVLEVDVEDFGEGEHADCFVVAFAAVDQLMGCLSL